MGSLRIACYLYAVGMARIPPARPASRHLADFPPRDNFSANLAPDHRQNDVGLRALLQTAFAALHYEGVHLLVNGVGA